jgi:hypothetical protein
MGLRHAGQREERRRPLSLAVRAEAEGPGRPPAPTRSRAGRGQHRGRCRSTPTPGIDLEATHPVAGHLTLDQAAAHQRLRHRAPRRHRAVRHGQGRASVTDPSDFPGGASWDSSTTASRASTSAPAIRSPPAGGHRHDLADVRLRCCPISTRTTSAGCRSSNAARGTDLALGPSATPPRRGFRWPPAEQPAPPRASRRLPRGRVWLAPAVRAWRRPVGLSVPPTTGAGPRRARP